MADKDQGRGMTGRHIALIILLLFGVLLAAFLISGLVLKMRVNYQIRHYRRATCIVRSYNLETRTDSWAKGNTRNKVYEIFDVSYVAGDGSVVYGRIATRLFNHSPRTIGVSVFSSSRAYPQRKYIRKWDLAMSLAQNCMLYRIEPSTLLVVLEWYLLLS